MTIPARPPNSADVSGLPICTTSCQIPHAAIGVYVDPVIVEPGQLSDGHVRLSG